MSTVNTQGPIADNAVPIEHAASSSTNLNGSFYDVGQYKRTVRRVEDGNKLCNDLVTMLQERIELEKYYAKSLKAWYKKWSDNVSKGPEYGSTKQACFGICNEGDKVADVHLLLRERLLGNVQAIKQWQKEKFHKPALGGIKEAKDLDDTFKKVQKPWAKRHDKVMKAKKDFHSASRQEASALHQQQNALKDQSTTAEQKKKLEDKVLKAKRDVENSRTRYNQALNEINGYNAKYADEMRTVFQGCQDYEAERLTFVKQMLGHVVQSVDISSYEQFPAIFRTAESSVEQANAGDDLQWWARHHGADMSMQWPQFEEYSPHLAPIGKGKSQLTNDGVTLTANRRSVVAPLQIPQHDSNHNIYEEPLDTGGTTRDYQNAMPVSNDAASGSERHDAACTGRPSDLPIVGAHTTAADNREALMSRQSEDFSDTPHVYTVIDRTTSAHSATSGSDYEPLNMEPAENGLLVGGNAVAEGGAVGDDSDRGGEASSSGVDVSSERGRGGSVKLKHHTIASHSMTPRSDSIPSAYSAVNGDHAAAHRTGSGAGVANDAQSTGSGASSAVAVPPLPASPPPPSSNFPLTNGGAVNGGPRESNEWSSVEELVDPLVDTGELGVPVRAMYDYDGQEDDELTFRTGDKIDKLSEPDEQGWCKARFNGRVGLYPATYCENIQSSA